ncbi:MAG: T9SS type A sorting domain-containing protein [Ferruginibacter sp.]
MKNIYLAFAVMCIFSNTITAQTVTPSVISFKKAEEIEKLIPPPSIKKIGNKETMEDERLPMSFRMPYNANKQYQPDALKVVNPNSVSIVSPSPLNNFLGLGDNASIIPPDVHGVAGPNHLMVVHNSEFKIMDKTGVQISKTSASSFWSGVSPNGLSDPHVEFDKYTNRWIMIGQSNLDATSSLLVAVSQSSDPTGNWNRYAFRVDLSSTLGFDYPLVGYNQNWLVVTGNMFSIAASSFQGTQIYIFDMASLNTGAAVTIGTNAQRISNATGSGSALSPVTTFESGAPTNPLYIVQNWNGGSAALRLSTLTGTIPSVAWNEISASFPTGSTAWSGTSGLANNNSSPQAVEARKINSGDNRMCNAVMVNGKIWTTHHVFLPQGAPTRAAIQWWQLQPNGAVLQNGLIDDADPNIHRTYPTIAVNPNEDVLIGYSRFSTTTFPSAAYSFRKAATAVNTLNDEVVYLNGKANYWKDFGAGRARWGDYSNTCLDPISGRFWTLQEFADNRNGAGTVDGDSRWGSWWAEVAPAGAANEVYFLNSGLIVSETGTTGTCPRYKDITVPIGISGTATGNSTLTFTGSGTATSGQDYSILTPTLNYINGDNTTKTITIRIFDDAAVEGTETLNLSYTISGTGVIAATTGQLTSITITDDDVAPVALIVKTNSLGSLTTNLSASTPFKGSGGTQGRMQNLYTASDLQAAGFGAGQVTNFAYYFNSGFGITYDNMNLSLANTSATTLTAFINPAPSFTTVYSGNFTSPGGAGWTDIPLSSTFTWDGISNVVVQLCYDLPATVADVNVLGTAASGYTPTAFVRQSTGSGCTLSATNTSSFRPDIRLTMNINGPSPETNLNATKTVSFGPNEDVYVYNGAGKIMGRVKNLSSFDYGCTQFIIDRQGTSAVQFWNNTTANYLMSKSFKVIPTNNSATGSYEVTLYYTAAEVTGWQTLTGQNITSAQMVKVSNGFYIPDVTIATPHFADVTIVGATSSAYGSDYALKATFTNTSFSGFGIGIPSAPVPVTALSFNGYERNKAALLNWTTTSESNNKGFELEKSFDGINFSKITFVQGAGNSSTNRNYIYTDPSKLTTVQYYRLKQVDFDGRYNYSGIIAIRKNEKTEFDILSVTNPFKNDVKIIFTDAIQGKAQFELYDANGKLIMNNSQMVYGTNASFVVPSSAAAGTYILKIMINDLVFNERLIKH